MTPSPLPSYTVNLLLRYISPLDDALPPHLLSKTLLQRHHFLSLNPVDDPGSYLCWPSSLPHESDRVLESLSFLPPIDETQEYTIKYVADGEHVYAHVHVDTADPNNHDGGLRAVFLWDSPDSHPDLETHNDAPAAQCWKYHDIKLMPFPRNACDSLEDALRIGGSHPLCNHASHTLTDSVPDNEVEVGDDSGDDTYWDAYGRQDDEGEQKPEASWSISQDDSEKAEDAYWAQYAAVQGSADSTVPSPRPNSHRKTFIPPESIRVLSSSLSSADLAWRLTALSPRLPPPTSPGPEERHNQTDTSWQESESSTLSSSSDEKFGIEPRAEVAHEGEHQLPRCESDEVVIPIPSSHALPELLASIEGEGQTIDDGLRQTIVGVHRIWAAGRRNAGKEVTKELFLQLVANALED